MSRGRATTRSGADDGPAGDRGTRRDRQVLSLPVGRAAAGGVDDPAVVPGGGWDAIRDGLAWICLVLGILAGAGALYFALVATGGP